MIKMINNLPPSNKSGLFDRRLFLKKGLVFSTTTFLCQKTSAEQAHSLPPWMKQPGESFSNYGQPSAFERKTIRWTMTNSATEGNGVSWTPLHLLEGMITPSGLHFERHHNGVPIIPPGKHQLLIHGAVKRSLVFNMAALARYPLSSIICFIECGGNSNAGWHDKPKQTAVGYFHGMASTSEWSGIPLNILLDEAELTPQAKWLIAEGADAAAMNISIPIEKAMDDCILATYQNGEKIRPENGYPLRLIVPGWEGVTHVKWLRRIHISSQPVMARNETAKYTELLPSGKARQFSFEMDAKSIITKPSFGQHMEQPGLYQISGLAWSGKGKIKKVEVSADAGQTWEEAELQSPVLSKCFTRFRIPWYWNGKQATLKSRATDETGYVQPERDDLLAKRGKYGYFHYNAIVSWQISRQGEITHVYA